MYSNKLGRFTTTDPLLSSSKVENSQSWNRYAYVLNNPLKFTDPAGMYIWDKSLGGESDDQYVSRDVRFKRDNFRQGLARAKENLEKIKSKYGENSDKYKKAQQAVESYGNEGDKGVTIKVVKDGAQKHDGITSGTKGDVVVSFRESFLSDGNGLGENRDIAGDMQGLIAHEGYHVSIKNLGKTIPKYTNEFDAYSVQGVLREVQNPDSQSWVTLKSGEKAYLWDSAWEKVDIDTKRGEAIKSIIKDAYPGVNPPAPIKKKKP